LEIEIYLKFGAWDLEIIITGQIKILISDGYLFNWYGPAD
jgi:hypothetical protein